MTELEKKYIVTNDALCCVIMWEQEFKKQILLDITKNEDEKQKHLITVSNFIGNLKKALNKSFDLKLK